MNIVMTNKARTQVRKLLRSMPTYDADRRKLGIGHTRNLDKTAIELLVEHYKLEKFVFTLPGVTRRRMRVAAKKFKPTPVTAPSVAKPYVGLTGHPMEVWIEATRDLEIWEAEHR